MITENKVKGNRPAYSQGNVAIWKKELNPETTIFEIVDGPKDGQKTYLSCFGTVAGHELKAEEVAALYKRQDVPIVLKGQHGPYDASMACREIKITTKKVDDGKVYENKRINIGLATHLKTKEGEHYGYKIEGAKWFKKAGPKDASVELTATDCFTLLRGDVVQKNGLELSAKIGQKEDEMVASVGYSRIGQEQKEEQKEEENKTVKI